MFRKMLICVFLTGALLISGVWDYQDLDDLAIYSSEGYDYKDGQIQISVTGVAPLYDDHGDSKVLVLSSEGKSIGETRGSRALSIPEELVYGALQTIVFGREISAAGIASCIDMNYRSAQTKLNTYLALASNGIDEIYNQKCDQSEDVGRLLNELLSRASKDTIVPQTTVHDLALSVYTDDHGDVVIPEIIHSKTGIEIIGLAVFKRDKMVGEATDLSAVALTYLRGTPCKGSLDYKTDDDSGTLSLQNKRHVSVSADGDRLCFTVDIDLRGEIYEHSNPAVSLRSPEEIRKTEEAVTRVIRDEIDQILPRIQKQWKCDCIDLTRFAKKFFRKDRPEDYRDLITDSRIIVNVETKLTASGEIT